MKTRRPRGRAGMTARRPLKLDPFARISLYYGVALTVPAVWLLCRAICPGASVAARWVYGVGGVFFGLLGLDHLNYYRKFWRVAVVQRQEDDRRAILGYPPCERISDAPTGAGPPGLYLYAPLPPLPGGDDESREPEL